jgi:hypothetical protein
VLAFTPLLIAIAVVAVCALIGWLRWLRFNLDVYDRAQTVEVFERTPQVARSFLQSIRPRAHGAARSSGVGRREGDPPPGRDSPDGAAE